MPPYLPLFHCISFKYYFFIVSPLNIVLAVLYTPLDILYNYVYVHFAVCNNLEINVEMSRVEIIREGF